MGRLLTVLALFTTLVTGGALTAAAATVLTLDGQSLQLVAGAIGLCGALVVPMAVSLGLARSLEQQGRAIRRAPILGLSMVILHAAISGGLYVFMPDVQSTVEDGWVILIPGETVATEEDPVVIETRGPVPGTTVEVAAAQQSLSALLSGHVDGLSGLTNSTAASIGVVWMRELDASHPDGLATHITPELWAALHEGLTPAPGLWNDAAKVEAVVVPRGRSFMVLVASLADHLTPRRGVGRLVWIALPPTWVAAEARGDSPAWTADYKRIERDRMVVTIAGTQRELIREDGEWRLDLGAFGEVANQPVDPRTMWLALLP